MFARAFALLAVTCSLAMPQAHAQSAVAAINGTAEQGNTVSIENLDTGRTRELEVGKRGRFQFRALPPGFYDVVIRQPDGTIVKSQMVTLRVGTSATVRQGPRSEVSAAVAPSADDTQARDRSAADRPHPAAEDGARSSTPKELR